MRETGPVASCSNFRQNSGELLGVEVALVGGKAECALRGDRGDEIDRVAGTGGAHDRSVSDRGPGGAGVVIRAQSGLVEEVDRRPVFCRLARIAGDVSVFHCSAAPGVLWWGRERG